MIDKLHFFWFFLFMIAVLLALYLYGIILKTRKDVTKDKTLTKKQKKKLLKSLDDK